MQSQSCPGILKAIGGTVFARWLYTLFFYLLTPFILLRLWWRARLASEYGRRWRERFGFVPDAAAQTIWVHAVSVGETMAAVPLIKALLAHYPDHSIAVTTMTPTGSERVRALFGDSVYHVYAPYDLPDVLKRFFRQVRPKLLIIMETELWPNTIHACHRRNIPVILANARLSQKSANGYNKVRWLASPMMRELSAIAAQTQADAERFQCLGVDPQSITVSGNIKFDLSISEHQRSVAERIRVFWQGSAKRPVLLAASTHAGEDEIILKALELLRSDIPRVLLVLVPRHPERFDDVARLCLGQGFTLHRHSTTQQVNDRDDGSRGLPATVDVVLGDTMGELLTFCGASDLVFVGGSLLPIGGHNVIEPAAWAKPVLSGPHVFNFTEATELLLEAGGMVFCASAESIAEEAEQLLAREPQALAESQSQNARYLAMSRAALAVTESNRGALGRLLSVIEPRVRH